MIVKEIGYKDAMTVIDELQNPNTLTQNTMTVNNGHHPLYGPCAVIVGLDVDALLITLTTIL